MKKVIALTLVGCLLVTGMTGCNKKDKDPLLELNKQELVDMINGNTKTLEDDANRIAELEQLLKGIQEENPETPGIKTIEDGTGRLTFTTVDGLIEFPSELGYPNSEQAANTGSINITQALSIAPTGKWLVNLDGTTLHLNHPTGVVGVIRAGSIQDIYPRDKLKEKVFEPFFADFPPETITYNKLFIDNNWWGLQAVTPTTVNEQPAQIRCGVVGMAETSFTFVFVYMGENDSTKDELELTLLKSIKLYNNNLKIQ